MGWSMGSRVFFLILFALCLLSDCAFSSKRAINYQDRDEVIIYAGTVAPHANPQETYKLYDLLFCQPKNPVPLEPKNLGSSLQGYSLVSSDFKLQFKTDIEKKIFCYLHLTESSYQTYLRAVVQHYRYYLFIEDLFELVPIGKVIDQTPFVYTHLIFEIYYKDHELASFRVKPENPLSLSTSGNYTFTYSVKWNKYERSYSDRMNQYYEEEVTFQSRWRKLLYFALLPIPWFGFVMILLLRIHRRGAVLDQNDEEKPLQLFDSGENEFKWKNIHGDVFRPPPYLILFSSMVGTGAQLFTLVIFILLFKKIYFKSGYVLSYAILGYALTSCIGGYVSGSIFFRNNGRRWTKNAFTTALFFPSFVSIVSVLVDMIISPYNTTSFIPPSTYLTLFCIWLFAVLPLTFCGAVLGRYWNVIPSFACRVNPVPRIIPDAPWYRSRCSICLLAGLILFLSFSVQLYTILNAVWYHKYYRILSYLPTDYVTICLVTCFLSITLIHWFIRGEDYRWHWVSFLSGASVSVYVFLYSVNFYLKKGMFGLLQTSYFFGYTLVLCAGIGLVGGFISFYSSLAFIQFIYKYIKAD